MIDTRYARHGFRCQQYGDGLDEGEWSEMGYQRLWQRPLGRLFAGNLSLLAATSWGACGRSDAYGSGSRVRFDELLVGFQDAHIRAMLVSVRCSCPCNNLVRAPTPDLRLHARESGSVGCGGLGSLVIWNSDAERQIAHFIASTSGMFLHRS